MHSEGIKISEVLGSTGILTSDGRQVLLIAYAHGRGQHVVLALNRVRTHETYWRVFIVGGPTLNSGTSPAVAWAWRTARYWGARIQYSEHLATFCNEVLGTFQQNRTRQTT